MLKRARAIFRGRVQGVWFRANTERKARSAGLTGWVRNLPDGSVEAVFEGEEEVIERVLAEIDAGEGMGAARVSDISVEWGDFRGEYRSFSINR
ncbi:MAG: acylphosphatase [Thermoplasmatota archaeon]